MAEVIMPRLSDTMEEGSVAKWLKQAGDRVESGEIIAEIETDKAVMELEAFESGVLQQILVPEGEVVPIGRPIALIGEGAVSGDGQRAAGSGQRGTANGAAPSEPAAAAAPADVSAAEVVPAEAPATMPAQPAADGDRGSAGGRLLATPVARRIAEEYGVDLRQVRGTGPDGRIIRENVEDFVRESGVGSRESGRGASSTPFVGFVLAPPRPPTAPPAAAPGEVTPLSRIRRAVARSMNESKPGTPHLYVASEIDMAAALALRRQINEGEAADVKISVNDMIVKAAALALRKVPALNASYVLGPDGQPGVIQHERVNISVATALEDGLVAPHVRDADTKSLSTIAAEIKDLAGRAREGRLKQTEIDGGTFTVSNLGMFDVLEFVAVITPPQAAALAVGTVRRVPVVQKDGQLGAGERMIVVLSADHRVTDGATAARYLQGLKRLLETPLRVVV